MIHKLFTWPIDTVLLVGKKIQEEAEKELYDLETIQKKLVHLQMQHELNEMDEDTFIAQEKELIERYRIAKEREMNAETSEEER